MTAHSLNEVWAPVPGYEGSYSVSTLGRVRSEDKIVPHLGSTRCIRGRILKPVPLPKGYLTVNLYANRSPRHFLVHRLVLLTFVGDGGSLECCHNDGTKTNNSLSNLRWDTHSSNRADKIMHGTNWSGDQHWGSKIAEADAKAIFSDQRIQRVIAADYGICQAQVSRIKSGTRRAAASLPK